MWNSIVQKLTERGWTITAMESCTGGALADRITDVAGASAVLRESFVTYSNEAKLRRGVPAEVIAAHTVYSAETAAAMASAARRQTGADFAVGVTGLLGRIDPANPTERPGRVWFAIADAQGGYTVREMQVPDGERTRQKEAVVTRIGQELLRILDTSDAGGGAEL